MKLNWITVEQRKPQKHDGFNSPYIPCIVYSCNPNVKIGGVIEVCRWDVENNEWFKADINRNWLLQEPYQITHFADDVEIPFTK